MLICNDLKFVFIRNPKTASTSISKLISVNFDVVEHGEYHNNEIPKGLEGFYVFAFVRNPYTRMVSIWNHNKAVSEPFKEEFKTFKGYIEDLYRKDVAPPYLKQAKFIDGVGVKVNCFKFENLNYEYNQLPFVDRNQQIPLLNGRDYGDWMDYYDKDTRGKVAELLKEDFERFGY
jgi:hypothetical protein